MNPTEAAPSFYILCFILGWMALRGLLGGRSIFEFPTVAAMLGLAWVIPQGIELEMGTRNLDESSLFWFYVSACFVFVSWGFILGRRIRRRGGRQTALENQPRYRVNRLIVAAACLTGVGYVAQLLISGIDTSRMGAQWTGVITMYALLSKANGLGLCLSLLVFVHSRSRVALFVALLAALPLVSSAVVGVRREQIFDLLVLTFGAWYFASNRVPPRLIVVASLLIGTVILNSAEKLRIYVDREQSTLVGALLSPEVYQQFRYTNLRQGRSSEIGQAQYDFAYMNRKGEWELGAAYLNALSSQYVPAFLVGRDIKNSLRFETLIDRYDSGAEKGLVSVGSTRTGFSDSFRSFGWFGLIVFSIIGSIFGWLYSRAIEGAIEAQYYYFVFLAEGLKAITHSTGEFFASIPFVLILSVLVFRFSRVMARAQEARLISSSSSEAGLHEGRSTMPNRPLRGHSAP